MNFHFLTHIPRWCNLVWGENLKQVEVWRTHHYSWIDCSDPFLWVFHGSLYRIPSTDCEEPYFGLYDYFGQLAPISTGVVLCQCVDNGPLSLPRH